MTSRGAEKIAERYHWAWIVSKDHLDVHRLYDGASRRFAKRQARVTKRSSNGWRETPVIPALIDPELGRDSRIGNDLIRCRETMEFRDADSRFETILTQLSFAARPRSSKERGAQARRLLALAAIYDGSTRREAAKIGGVTLQIVRDWVLKFQTLMVPSGLIAGQGAGADAAADDGAPARRWLAWWRMARSLPFMAFVRWRLVDLCQWVFEEYSVVVSTQTMSREIAGHGLSQAVGAAQTSRPRRATAIEDF